MSAEILYALAGAALVAISLYVLVAIPHLLRKLLAFNILASGIFLMLTGLGQRGGEPDPIPQALVLTGIVVSFASTALALTLMRRWFRSSGRITLDSGLHGATSNAPADTGEHGLKHSADPADNAGSAAAHNTPVQEISPSSQETAHTATQVQVTAQAPPPQVDDSDGPARDWSR